MKKICLKLAPINFEMMNERGGEVTTEGYGSFMCPSSCLSKRERVSAALVKEEEEEK